MKDIYIKLLENYILMQEADVTGLFATLDSSLKEYENSINFLNDIKKYKKSYIKLNQIFLLYNKINENYNRKENPKLFSEKLIKLFTNEKIKNINYNIIKNLKEDLEKVKNRNKKKYLIKLENYDKKFNNFLKMINNFIHQYNEQFKVETPYEKIEIIEHF
ncbi:MAG: hypothetical protein ACOC3Z_00980 [Nanoarchaeota archaeon]